MKFSNKPGGRPTKRKTLKQKYKIQRKIKAFHKRSRRTARKLRATGAKKGGKQENPLPNMFPFKTEIIQATKRERDYLTSLKKSKKSKGQQIQPQNEVTLANNKKQFTNIESIIGRCDVVIEVLDARDPAACRNITIEQQVVKQGKKLVLLLNKIDLVSFEVACGWQKLLNAVYPTVMYNCVGAAVKTTAQGTSLGHGYLFHLIRNLTQLDKSTVGVVGAAGVGRASFIDSLSKVGRTNGVNLEKQQVCVIEVNKHINLLDTIGLLKLNPVPLILRGRQRNDRTEQLVEEILKAVSHESLLEIYRVPKFVGLQDYLLKVAKATGQLQKGGVPDLKKTVTLLCEDWSKQRVPFSTTVPTKLQ